MVSTLFLIQLCTCLPWISFALPHGRSIGVQGRPRGYHLQISRRAAKRGDVSGSIGLGNNGDLLYTVPIELGNSVLAVNIDTGSSDLWVVSDLCQSGTCNGTDVARYDSSSLRPAGADVKMLYGDSTSGSFASGPIGIETATIAGVAMTGQSFGAMNETDNIVVQFGASGIFGLGFSSGSNIQEAIVTVKDGPIIETDDYVSATYTDGPLLSRMAMTGALESPMFSISLQRDTIDISGNGELTIGKLPDGIDNSSLTWVPVRLYSVEDGGLKPPSFAPNEVYPFRWEVDIDGVYLDGQKLPDSAIPATAGDSSRTSALIDTGNSLLRGPSDVVSNVLSTVSKTFNPTDSTSEPTLPCAVPRTIAFQINGKMFPVDPRDFISPLQANDSTDCVADNLVSTDAPSFGALYRWSLGDPFMKSNLVVFYYGNLTHPSVDPPRIGFLSTVPSNADDLLTQAVQAAQSNGGNFEQTLQAAPTASAAAEGQITVSPGSRASTSASSASATSTTSVVAAAAVPTPNVTSSSNLNQSNSALSLMRVSGLYSFFVVTFVHFVIL